MGFVKKLGDLYQENKGVANKVGIGLLIVGGVALAARAIGNMISEEDADYEVVSDEVVPLDDGEVIEE